MKNVPNPWYDIYFFEKILVKIDSELEDLIPIYIGTKRKDISAMLEALPNGDYETIRLRAQHEGLRRRIWF